MSVSLVEAVRADRHPSRKSEERDTAQVVAASAARGRGLLTEHELLSEARAGVRAALPALSEGEREALAAMLCEKALAKHGTRERTGMDGREQVARRESLRRFPSSQDRGRRVVEYLRIAESAPLRIHALAVPRELVGRESFKRDARRYFRDSREWRDSADTWKVRERDDRKSEAVAELVSLESEGAGFLALAEARESLAAGQWEAVSAPLPEDPRAVAEAAAALLEDEHLAELAECQQVYASVRLALADARTGGKVARELGISAAALWKRCERGNAALRDRFPEPDELQAFLARAASEAGLTGEPEASLDGGALRAAPFRESRLALPYALVGKSRATHSPAQSAAGWLVERASEAAKREPARPTTGAGKSAPMATSASTGGGRLFSEPPSEAVEEMGYPPAPSGLAWSEPAFHPTDIAVGGPSYAADHDDRVAAFRLARAKREERG